MSLHHEHSKAAISARLADANRPSYIRDWVYGGIDGTVTTFAIVAGIVGAELSTKIVIVLGLANLIADGFSMAASNYSGTKTEIDELERLREIEIQHIREFPDGEREEIRQILSKKGLEGQTLEDAVSAITSNEETWIETMLKEEYDLATVLRSPILSGAATFAAFIVCGAVPLLPYGFGVADNFNWSLFLTAWVFFGIGALKSRWSLTSWWRSGCETLSIGLAAAGMAYAVGAAFKAFI